MALTLVVITSIDGRLAALSSRIGDVKEMLVLSRKTGQRIVIGEDIEVTVVEVRRDRVKLAFEAPTSVFIHREEVMRRSSQPISRRLVPALTSTKAG